MSNEILDPNNEVCVTELSLLKDNKFKAILVYENKFIMFITYKNEVIRMHHRQDCCESVYIDDIVGDINNLLDTPIIKAEEKTNGVKETAGGDEEWTFYTLATIKGYVDIKWYGSSNGYYSTSVDVSEYPMHKVENYLKCEVDDIKELKLFTNLNLKDLKLNFETKLLN